MTQWFYPGQEDYINKLNDLAAIAELSVGPKGDTGDPGPAGMSAYEEALANGFVGTEAEWLASLVGPAGPSGAASWDDISGKPTLGTVAALNAPSSGDAGSTEVVKGNDTRLTDSRSPSGGAGGVLSGSYPNPGFAVDMATQEELDAVAAAVSTKQATLVSGTNIKTINGGSLLGSGDLLVDGGGPLIDSLTITYNGDGTIATLTEDGVVKAFAYNGDGTINTVSWPIGALTRTETYSYSSGVLTGMTAVEA